MSKLHCILIHTHTPRKPHLKQTSIMTTSHPNSDAKSKTIVLITGANIGVGKATAAVLASSSPNYHVILTSRSEEKGTAALHELQASGTLQGTLSWQQLDVTSDASIAAAAAAVEKDYGRVDVLINNAAHGGMETMQAPMRQHFTEVIDTNTVGPVLVTEAFKHLLLKSEGGKGRVIFVSSGLGSVGRKLNPASPDSVLRLFSEGTPPLLGDVLAYRVSKAGLHMVAAHYHVELKDAGVKVHVLCPGFVATNLRRDKEPLPTALPPETSGRTIKGIIEGERDADLGKFVHCNEGEGTYPW